MKLLTTRDKIKLHIGLAIQSAKIELGRIREKQSGGGECEQKLLDTLTALDKETATTQDVLNNIGTKINQFVCSECQENVNAVVQFEECKLCEACIKKGFELIHIR